MALLFAVLLGLSACVLGYLNYYFNRDHYIQGPVTIADTEIKYLIMSDISGNLIRDLEKLSRENSRIYFLRGADSQYLAGNIFSLPQKISVLTEGVILFDVEKRNIAAKVHIFDDGRTLIAGVDITREASAYKKLQWLSLITIALMSVVVIISFLISTFVVNRTNSIAATAKSIMETGDLSQRISIDARWDDIGNMAYVLNSLLGRIEDLMTGIRHVSDNIAHDLRTPLTRLLNQLEIMRQKLPEQEGQYLLNICDAAIEETHRLLRTFNALLRITSIETRQQRFSFQDLNLDTIILDVVELYEPLADEKSISLNYYGENIVLAGDRDLLFQAFANILSNAIEYTQSGGKINLRLKAQEGSAHFLISDNGPGIKESDRDKVFDRFYRSDSSRGGKGNGLGLSLVRAIVNLHEGKIILGDANPGLTFEIIF
ncbi:MAG: two-component sensor histidine kinase [Micavibrio aeruginosavorus]|uniref:histidine kinase n=1 Tax=Micavibrio aeruginosavorus TaxID=349221 RepID=A0A2W5HRJ3_9BACT|nr:MAG: two-component sensor histidine kinase [Micavibrio aeruginosavorus]